MEKKCFKCGKVKPLSEFYKHKAMKDGHVNKCKTCNKKDVSKNYSDNKDYYKNYDQKRNQVRKEYNAERSADWQAKNPEKAREMKQQWVERNREKKCANSTLNNAIRDGILTRGICQICGEPEAEGHHYYYSKPLNVVWLCKKHHEAIHWWLRWNKRNSK